MDVADSSEAEESSKEEEFLAICELHGVGSNAPLAKQLQAVDKEYRTLKEQGNQAKAEHVQGLYNWKSHKAMKVRLGESCH